MTGFIDDKHNPGVRLWRKGWARAIFSGVMAVFIGTLALGMTGLALWLMVAMRGGVGIGLFMAAIAAFQWALVAYVWRDSRGRRGGRIAISDAEIDLVLPANRSLIYRPPACRAHLAWSEVAGVSTRLEAYGAQGMAMLQRPYWLMRWVWITGALAGMAGLVMIPGMAFG
ncbi:hypothetical protein [uncultured Sphingomonas sp.]|uniref:hypothetical protein n=1 Tax=uncultured Sphingomonas sp. TaxID=158754 RepID=UPI0035C9F0B6